MRALLLAYLALFLSCSTLCISWNVLSSDENSGFVHLRREDEAPRRLDELLAKGKKAAMFQCHFEGNLGDQMETIPVLQRLYEWGVTTDCYLSVWQPEEKRDDPNVHARMKKYVNNVYNKKGRTPIDQMRHSLLERKYDVAIIAPGPTVNELTYCVPSRHGGNVSMVWFGVSATRIAWKHTYHKHKYCLKFIAVREEISYVNIAEAMEADAAFLEGDTKLQLSADFSFSYKPDQAEVHSHRAKFEKALVTLLHPGEPSNCPKAYDEVSGTCRDWVVIFSRENNFGGNGGVKIKDDSKVYVHTLDHHYLVYDIDKVVFASSSGLEDAEHMENIRKTWKIPRARMITLSTIEEMFGLVSLAPGVISDRYHPGVSALVLGTPLTVTKYRAEAVKMTGLWRMQKYKREDFLRMNEKAFGNLLKVINGEPLDDIPLIDIRDTNGAKRKKKRVGAIDAVDALNALEGSEDSPDIVEPELSGGASEVPQVAFPDAVPSSLDTQEENRQDNELRHGKSSMINGLHKDDTGSSEGTEGKFLESEGEASSVGSLVHYFNGFIHLVGIAAIYYVLYKLYLCM